MVEVGRLAGPVKVTYNHGLTHRRLYSLPVWFPGRASMRRRARRLLRRWPACWLYQNQASRRALTLLMPDFDRGMTLPKGTRQRRHP